MICGGLIWRPFRVVPVVGVILKLEKLGRELDCGTLLVLLLEVTFIDLTVAPPDEFMIGPSRFESVSSASSPLSSVLTECQFPSSPRRIRKFTIREPPLFWSLLFVELILTLPPSSRVKMWATEGVWTLATNQLTASEFVRTPKILALLQMVHAAFK